MPATRPPHPVVLSRSEESLVGGNPSPFSFNTRQRNGGVRHRTPPLIRRSIARVTAQPDAQTPPDRPAAASPHTAPRPLRDPGPQANRCARHSGQRRLLATTSPEPRASAQVVSDADADVGAGGGNICQSRNRRCSNTSLQGIACRSCRRACIRPGHSGRRAGSRDRRSIRRTRSLRNRGCRSRATRRSNRAARCRRSESPRRCCPRSGSRHHPRRTPHCSIPGSGYIRRNRCHWSNASRMGSRYRRNIQRRRRCVQWRSRRNRRSTRPDPRPDRVRPGCNSRRLLAQQVPIGTHPRSQHSSLWLHSP